MRIGLVIKTTPPIVKMTPHFSFSIKKAKKETKTGAEKMMVCEFDKDMN